MARFLDETGLKALWEKVKSYVASALSGYATTDALAEVQTTADGAQTAVGNMALSVDDGTLNWTDQEGVKTGYAIGGGGSLSEADANALEALKGGTVMFEMEKVGDDAPSMATVIIDGVAYNLAFGKKYSFLCTKNLNFSDGSVREKQSVAWNNFSNFATGGLTSMEAMFYANTKLESIDTSNWDTSNVTNMDGVFESCAFETIDVSKWDVSKVTKMRYMFRSCYKLKSLDVSGWNTSNVVFLGGGWSGMFQECHALQSLDVSGWDVSNVTDMRFVFDQCRSLQVLDLSGWDVSNLTDTERMLSCVSLTTLIGTHTLEEVEAGTVVALSGLKAALSLSSTKLERASLLAVIKGLADLTGSTAQTLTLGSTLKAKLTEDDIAIATAKNWVIA